MKFIIRPRLVRSGLKALIGRNPVRPVRSFYRVPIACYGREMHRKVRAFGKLSQLRAFLGPPPCFALLATLFFLLGRPTWKLTNPVQQHHLLGCCLTH